MNNIKQELLFAMNDEAYFSLSPEDAANVAFGFVKKYVEKAIDETNGYHTDVEYISGKSKEEFMKDNGLI